MRILRSVSAIALLSALLLQTAVANPESKNAAVNAKIREEAMKNSQVMRTLHYLTDVYGPRLTGSPKLVNAGKWAMKQMDEWGFDKTEMEPWDWGHEGWENDRASGFIVSPVKDSLTFEVVAWTPSTKGVVKAEVVQVTTPRIKVNENRACDRNPTQEELTSYLSSLEINNKIVLAGNPSSPGVDFDPPAKRLVAEQLTRRLRGGGFGTGRGATNCPKPEVTPLGFRAISSQLSKFIKDNNVLVQVNDGRMRHGMVRAFGNRSFDSSTAAPTVVLRNEDFGRISRLLNDGKKVELEFDIQNSIYPEGKTQYNTIGEITGTEKPDEVIMLGGHLDSWHSATGATDNAIGCSVMMEAARILKAIDVKPKRTIRVALWSGEEQGLLGSQAYVKKHFGSAENPTPAHSKFGGYFNIDSGTGRARGMSVFGPESAATILNEATKTFSDLEFVAVSNTKSRRLGGSDHTSFNQAGLPGIGVLQDPIEYFTHTWHTNLDTYERVVEDDVKASAAIVAAAVYELAMRDELLPRFSESEMPKLPGRRQ